MQFHQLNGPTGRVLLPKSVDVLTLTEVPNEPDTYWLEGVWPNSERKSVKLSGPLDAILETLGDTEARDLRAQHEKLTEQLFHAESELHDRTAELRAIAELDTSVAQWNGVHVDSCPTLWSTYRVRSRDFSGAWTTNLRFFAAGLGTTGQGFDRPTTLPQTNVKDPGRIPMGQAWMVRGIKLEVLTGSNAVVEALKRFAVLSFDFAQTSISICPVGAMTWDETGRVGRFIFGDEPDTEEATEANRAASHVASHLHEPPRFIRFGGSKGVLLPGTVTFSVLLSARGEDVEDAFREEIHGVDLRISLSGVYVSSVEIG